MKNSSRDNTWCKRPFQCVDGSPYCSDKCKALCEFREHESTRSKSMKITIYNLYEGTEQDDCGNKYVVYVHLGTYANSAMIANRVDLICHEDDTKDPEIFWGSRGDDQVGFVVEEVTIEGIDMNISFYDYDRAVRKALKEALERGEAFQDTIDDLDNYGYIHDCYRDGFSVGDATKFISAMSDHVDEDIGIARMKRIREKYKKV